MTLKIHNKLSVLNGTALAVSGSIIAMAFSTAAWAQAEPAETDSTNSNSVGDIVVTANKRTQRLSDVGLAVSVLGGDALKDQKISSLADIAQSVPGLSYTP